MTDRVVIAATAVITRADVVMRATAATTRADVVTRIFESGFHVFDAFSSSFCFQHSAVDELEII